MEPGGEEVLADVLEEGMEEVLAEEEEEVGEGEDSEVDGGGSLVYFGLNTYDCIIISRKETRSSYMYVCMFHKIIQVMIDR